ncbi:MAG: hypothetical protein Q7S02_03530, partial [bacterium]|nr:hypothetical protein [bacterium]
GEDGDDVDGEHGVPFTVRIQHPIDNSRVKVYSRGCPQRPGNPAHGGSVYQRRPRETTAMALRGSTSRVAYRGWRRSFPMQDSRFDVGQIAELRRIEDARVKRRQSGLHSEFSTLITRLTSGGVGTPDPAKGRKHKKSGSVDVSTLDPHLLTQAKVLWDKGWANSMLEHGIVDFGSFEEYASSLPDIPTFPETYDTRFPHLVLVDRRPFVLPEQLFLLTEVCSLLGVKFDGDNTTFVPYDPAHLIRSFVYWMRIQDGKIHRNRKPDDCRTEFTSHGDEVGCSAFEGLSLYAQHPDLLEVDTTMDLPGSVRADGRGLCACLLRWADGGVGLYGNWHGHAHPRYGSVSRGSERLIPRS